MSTDHYHMTPQYVTRDVTVAGGSPYGVTFGGAGAGAGGVYAPPPYEQLQHHQAIPALSQQLPVRYTLLTKVCVLISSRFRMN